MENVIIKDKHILIVPEQIPQLDELLTAELEYLKKNFCGIVYANLKDFSQVQPENRIIFLCGDISSYIDDIQIDLDIKIIREFSHNYDNQTVVNLGEVPILLHGVGIYFRNLFPAVHDLFKRVEEAHKFQSMTESSKPGTAFRTAIYLTDVQTFNNDTLFHLLRCSSNLDGPTDNFKAVDHEIINKANELCSPLFETPIELNHVLAQIYRNSKQSKGHRTVEKKAVIRAHSDKTKDMPRNALIAFFTLYNEPMGKPSDDNLFDSCHKNKSVYTCLVFRLKNTVKDPTLVKEFSVTLYPNSLFVIPLSTNRLYTHEIKASILPIDKIPTRLGYVIRCSKTKAIYRDGQTYIDNDGTLIKLDKINTDAARNIRELYLQENLSNEIIEYKTIACSMNDGDYLKPSGY